MHCWNTRLKEDYRLRQIGKEHRIDDETVFTIKRMGHDSESGCN